MRITSKQGQWLGDIAVRESGSLEAIVDMALINDVSITGKLDAGSSLLKAAAIDRRVMNFYQRNEIFPATKLPDNEGEGIEFWAVERDFEVS
jgi:hypothetical protein